MRLDGPLSLTAGVQGQSQLVQGIGVYRVDEQGGFQHSHGVGRTLQVQVALSQVVVGRFEGGVAAIHWAVVAQGHEAL